MNHYNKLTITAFWFLPALVAAQDAPPLISENFNEIETGQQPPGAIIAVGTGSEVRVVDKDSDPAHPFPEEENKSLFVRTPNPGHTHTRFEGADINRGLVRGTAAFVIYPETGTRSFVRLADFVLAQNAEGEWVRTLGTTGWAVQLQFGTGGRLFVSSGQVIGDLAEQRWVPDEPNVLEVTFDAETAKFSLRLNDEEVVVMAFGQPTTEFDFAGAVAKTISYLNLQVSAVAGAGNLYYDSIHIEGEWAEIEEPAGLAGWRMEHFGSPDNAGDGSNDADPEGDGVRNLVEYALGGDPTVADRWSILPILSVEDQKLVLTVTRPVGLPDILYIFEYSSDLMDWQSGQEHVTLDEPVANGDGTETVVARSVATVAADARGFLRLRVEEIP